MKNITNAILELGCQHLPCFAHSLNLVVKRAVSEVGEVASLVKKVKDVITYFHNSTIATNKLREQHRQKGSEMNKLKEDVEMHWNSTFDMLESYVEQRQEVKMVLIFCSKKDATPNPSDVSLARETKVTLQPFYEATNEMSGEKISVAAKVLP